MTPPFEPCLSSNRPAQRDPPEKPVSSHLSRPAEQHTRYSDSDSDSDPDPDFSANNSHALTKPRGSIRLWCYVVWLGGSSGAARYQGPKPTRLFLFRH